jgi:hypothetical protein
MKPEDNTGVEKVIEKVVGIKLNASRLTPMDYEECKKCMQEYSDQQNAELRQSLSELKTQMEELKKQK